MKTVTELNSKWWYRLINVIFIGFILLSSVGAIILIVDEKSPREVKDYKIECVADYSNHKTFIAKKDLDIYIFRAGSDTIYESLLEDAKREIKKACDISSEEAQGATDKAMLYINEQTDLGAQPEDIQSYIDTNLRPYLISETKVVIGSHAVVIAYSILSIIIILIIAVLIRRIFYYIVLGSLRPKK